jgi:hypothetical protein
MSGGTQTSWYAVGESGLKRDWFLWNKGDSTETSSGKGPSGEDITGPKGTFGVDMEGTLYTSNIVATGGSIGDWEISNGVLSAFHNGASSFRTSMSATGYW